MDKKTKLRYLEEIGKQIIQKVVVNVPHAGCYKIYENIGGNLIEVKPPKSLKTVKNSIKNLEPTEMS